MTIYDFLKESVSVHHIILTALLSLVVYVTVFIAVLVDFYSGIRRSRRLGIKTKSSGLRRSIRKFNDYILFIIIATLVDMMFVTFSIHEWFEMKSVPYLTLLTGVITVGIEIRSVWENLDRNRQKDAMTVINALVEMARTKGEADELMNLVKKRLDTYDEVLHDGGADPLQDGSGSENL